MAMIVDQAAKIVETAEIVDPVGRVVDPMENIQVNHTPMAALIHLQVH
jgi:hypothetical protein